MCRRTVGMSHYAYRAAQKHAIKSVDRSAAMRQMSVYFAACLIPSCTEAAGCDSVVPVKPASASGQTFPSGRVLMQIIPLAKRNGHQVFPHFFLCLAHP